ncbi:MAG: TIGR04002 family protein [Oscillospiraceae bacterium]|nr:TIGR04002 family protein [Oscillospiraceae bacterium]
MTNKKTKNMVFAAMFAAIITVLTAYFHVNIGTNSGYIHFGDSMIYLAASLLPGPYALCAASIGGTMADLLSGSAAWAPATAVIKPLNVVPFLIMLKFRKNSSSKIITPASAVTAGISGIITIAGYFLAEGIIFGFPGAVATLPTSFIQPLGSMIIYCLAGSALDQVKFKTHIFN